MEPPAAPPFAEQVRALRESAGGLWLDDRAVITVRGDDRLTWLNGVVTADLRALALGHGLYTAIVAVKGRLLGDAFVHRTDDAVQVVVPAAQREALMGHFERFIVMEDAMLEATPERVFTVQGPAALSATEGWPGRSTADRLGRGGVDALLGEGAEAPRSGAVTLVSREAFDAESVAQARPRWGADFGADNFVQEAAITPRAVSFQKGCYLGQEVVCRLQMRGHVQRLLVSLTQVGKTPQPGAEVTSEGKVVGRVTGVSPALEGEPARLLAMVKYAVTEKRPALEIDGAPAEWAP